jgi:CRISPR-associated RAMP protein (TIGR02581 family)
MIQPAHDRLLQRYSIRGNLVCDSAVHVGSSGVGAEALATDMPVARDGRGRPYLPGASLRGALRAGIESLLRGLDRPGHRVCDPFDKQPGAGQSCSERVNQARKDRQTLTEAEAFQLAWDNACEVCKLFGHSFLASRVRLADLPLQPLPGAALTYTRDGVGLDRDLRTAARGILYNFEAVPAAARFALRIEFENAEPHEMGLLLIGLDLFAEGLATVGGKSARGLGLARVESLAIVRRKPADFFAGTAGAALDQGHQSEFRAAAQRYYLGGAD